MRLIASTLLASLGTVAFFGIALSVLWYASGESSAVKLITTLISAALAIAFGSFIAAWIARSHNLKTPAAFGLIFGAFSFGYVLGLDLRILAIAIASALAAGAGGVVFLRTLGRSRTSGNLDAD